MEQITREFASESADLLRFLTVKSKGSYVTAAQIKRDIGIDGEKLRAIVNFLRSHKYPICSSRQGYRLINSSRDIKECINNLRSRAEGIMRAVFGLEQAYMAAVKREEKETDVDIDEIIDSM